MFSILLAFSLWCSLSNDEADYSLINSVDFHPKESLFCATYTHNNKICIYKLENGINLIQTIRGLLKQPQHAVFSPDGQKLAVVNWTDRSLYVFPREKDGSFSLRPISSVFLPLTQSKPHGIAYSPSGQYLAVACGASREYENGLVLFENIGSSLETRCVITHEKLLGIPKGICFSPDSKCLLVTFCEPSCVASFYLEGNRIDPSPKQILKGVSRPEDVKIAPDGSYFAVSNSDQNRITFYSFDKNKNRISDNYPFLFLEKPEADLIFPHGIAFSSDGSYLAITQFGHINLGADGRILWCRGFPSGEASIKIYRVPEG